MSDDIEEIQNESNDLNQPGTSAGTSGSASCEVSIQPSTSSQLIVN